MWRMLSPIARRSNQKIAPAETAIPSTCEPFSIQYQFDSRMLVPI